MRAKDMDEKPVALFVMDGTLCDYLGQLKRDLENLMAPGEGPYEDLYDESKPWLKARMSLIKSQPGWWLNLPPLSEGFDVLHLCQQLGFDIEIVTKGPRSKRLAWKEKGEWVDAHL